MAISVVLTTTNAANQTWTMPPLSVGDNIVVETWAAASGASGGNTSNRAGGAGGAYSTATYTVTRQDVTNGFVTYRLSDGGAGSAGANSTAGPDCWWSLNNANLNPSTAVTAAVAGAPGTLPPNWFISIGTLSSQITSFGIDDATGIPYVEIRIFGTTSTTSGALGLTSNLADAYGAGSALISASTQYTGSVYVALTAGSLTNVTGVFFAMDSSNGATYVATPIFLTVSGLTGAMARFTSTVTTAATTITDGHLYVSWTHSSGVAVDFTIRIGGCQLEAAPAATYFKTTPGYVLAKGGGATSGTTGGVGGATATSVGATKFAGGSGATRAQGGGGGGAAGPAGAGASSTTGTGGAGDNGSGGAANTDNVEGGGGGTASASGHIGGLPGGGGGANTSTGSGGAGGRAQIRLTYTPTPLVPNILDAPPRQRVEMIAY